MAVKKANKKEIKKAEFRGFFNFEIPSEAKAACKDWIKQDDEIGLEIENALASGYKLTITRNERTDGYQASMQCNHPDDVNAGLCMSAYAAHWYLALGVLLFKHVVLLGKKWEATVDSTPMEDFG